MKFVLAYLRTEDGRDTAIIVFGLVLAVIVVPGI